MRRMTTLAVGTAVLLVAAIPAAFGQKGVGDATGVGRQAVQPDIVSLSGKVVEVTTGPCQATTGRSVSGTHVIVQADEDKQLNVHLGPAAAVADAVAELTAGQEVAVKAFRTEKMEENHYVAQSLVFGETTVVLRDEGLRPVWSGGSAGQPRAAAGGRAGPGPAGRGAGARPGPGWGRGPGGGRGAGWGRGQGRQRGQGWQQDSGWGRGQGRGRVGQQSTVTPQREPAASEPAVGKLAVTATKPSMDAAVDPQFGQASFFLIVDPEEETFEAVKNPSTTRGGAGVKSAELIASKGATVLLTGKVGAKAMESLNAVGIEVVPGCSGPVRTVLEQFKAGELQPDDASPAPSKPAPQ